MTGQILVVEDEAALRMLVVDALESFGFSVLEAPDGDTALDIIRGAPGICLLLSDIKMPGTDGYGLAKAALALRPGLKVMLMTGYSSEPPPAYLAGQRIEILHKPFDLDVLADKIKTLKNPPLSG